MVAWCRNGTSYTASTRLAAVASVAAASPSLRASTPGCSARLTNSARIPSESSDAASPSSHWISSARRPVTACQSVLATTATPAAQPAAHAPAVAVQVVRTRATTARTPGTDVSAVRTGVDGQGQPSRIEQHTACIGALYTQRIPRGTNRGATARGHAARPPGRVFRYWAETHRGPVGVQLFSEDHSQAGLR